MPHDALKTFATSVACTLSEAGHRAVFAGGCVRDLVLGKTPKDFDVATSATPQEVIKLFKRTVPVGVAFGVVRVVGPRVTRDSAPDAKPDRELPPLEVEVATFRSDGQYTDGRRPDSVQFTNEVEDVKRRDFTINGLLFDPLKGELLDYVGGQEDLKAKKLRAIGDPQQRFAEDRLRMLRAVRFAAALEFEIDPLTLTEIKRAAPAITEVSPERIRDELVKMLTGPDPKLALELLKKTRLLKEILPEIEALQGVEQPPEFHPEGDVWTHTLMLLGHLHNAPMTLALGCLLHDVGKPKTFQNLDRIRFNEHEKVGAEMTEQILRRLKFSNDEIERVTELVRQHMAFKDVQNMRTSTLKRFLRMPHFEEHLELHRIDCLSSNGRLENHEFCTQQLKTLSAEVLRPEPLVNGRDLMTLGVAPGPLLGKLLKEIEDKQLEGVLNTKEDALNFAREQLKL